MRKFIQDRGFTKSHILFLCLAILITYAIITQKPKTEVHKKEGQLENYNKLLIQPVSKGKLNGEAELNTNIKVKENTKVRTEENTKKIYKKSIVGINKQSNKESNKESTETITKIKDVSRQTKIISNTTKSVNPYQILKEDKAPYALNRQTDNMNVMIYWVDGKKLKVLSILSINQKNHKMAVITVPLFGQFLFQDKVVTIADYYNTYGRSKLTTHLEKLLEVKLGNYVLIQQHTLGKVSSLVGPVEVNGETLYIAKAFEETAAGLRKDDQDIVRALGEKLISRALWFKIPQLVWIFSREVETNFNGGQLWDIYKAAKGMEVGKLIKKPIQGIEYEIEGKEYRVLLARIYKNIIYDLTR